VAARPREHDARATPRPTLSLSRLFLLTIVTTAFAFALQALLAVTNAPAAVVISLLVLPSAAGAIVFAGLRPYPAVGRLRLALMVAVGLFLLGLILS
jgi:hypothetical protein